MKKQRAGISAAAWFYLQPGFHAQPKAEWRCIKCGSQMRESIVPIPGEGRTQRVHVCERCGCTVAK
jgi:DNA-directed RNA polymerase subunit RPC12/RpoP